VGVWAALLLAQAAPGDPALKPQAPIADPPSATGISKTEARSKALVAGDAVLLHEWTGTLALGFNRAGRLLVYDSGRNVFESHDLVVPHAAVTGWNQVADGGLVFSGVLSSDRRTLATLASMGRDRSQIQLWNVETGAPISPAFAPSDVAHVTFSPDGKSLAGVVAQDGTVRLWDTRTRELSWSQPFPESMQTTWIGLLFGPDANFLAARNSFGFSLWDATAQRLTGASTVTGERIF